MRIQIWGSLTLVMLLVALVGFWGMGVSAEPKNPHPCNNENQCTPTPTATATAIPTATIPPTATPIPTPAPLTTLLSGGSFPNQVNDGAACASGCSMGIGLGGTINGGGGGPPLPAGTIANLRIRNSAPGFTYTVNGTSISCTTDSNGECKSALSAHVAEFSFISINISHSTTNFNFFPTWSLEFVAD